MGIPTVEHFFHLYITNYFDFLKSNLYFVDYILGTSDVRLKDLAKKIVQKTPIKCFIMYPRTNVKSPFIAISIASEVVAANYIGDNIGGFIPIQESEVKRETLRFTNGETRLANFPVKTVKIFQDGLEVSPEEYLIDYRTGTIILGDRYNSTSTYTADYTYFQNYSDSLVYLNSYSVVFEVCSNNMDETVVLHRLLHHLFLSDRAFLAGIGMKNQTLSAGEAGADRSFSDQPEPLYVRTLHFNFDMEVGGIISHRVIKDILVERQ